MYYFIVNPNAGCGKGGRLWRAVAIYLEKHQVEYEAYLTACLLYTSSKTAGRRSTASA